MSHRQQWCMDSRAIRQGYVTLVAKICRSTSNMILVMSFIILPDVKFSPQHITEQNAVIWIIGHIIEFLLNEAGRHSTINAEHLMKQYKILESNCRETCSANFFKGKGRVII